MNEKSYLDSSDGESFELPQLHSEVFSQLTSGQPDQTLPHPSSGFVDTPFEISHDQPLFIVVDIYIRDIPSTSHPEKIIRLWPGKGHEERFVHLQDEWVSLSVSCGDSAFVIGNWEKKSDQFYSESLSTTISKQSGFFIVQPQMLISGTLMSKVEKCPRQAYLDETTPFGLTTAEFHRGNIIHALIQNVIQGHALSEIDVLLENLVDGDLETLLFINRSKETFMEELQAYLPPIKAMAVELSKSHFSLSKMPLLPSSVETVIPALPPFGCKTKAIEETLFSFQFGMKGRIDVALSYDGKLYPLELKSGLSGGKDSAPRAREEHNFQLFSYIAMMEEKYKEKAAKSGFLYYAKNNKSFLMSPRRSEMARIIIRRNELAYSLSHRVLPETCGSTFPCRYCPSTNECAFLEQGEKKASPIRKEILLTSLFKVKPIHLNFYHKWEQYLVQEFESARNGQMSLWLSSPKQREASGRAISGLEVVGSIGGHVTLLAPSVESIQRSSFSATDYVMITRNGIPPIIGRGVIIELKETSLTVEVSDCSLDESEKNICIDRWESSHSAEIGLRNLMTLFDKIKVQELIVEGREPQFDPLPQIDPIPSLNSDQNLAIKTAISAKDYMLLLGMPGTGKTTTIVSLIEVLAKKQNSVLIASYTHTAVDNICLKLQEKKIEFIRIGQSDKTNSNLKSNTIGGFKELKDNSIEELRNLLNSTKIYATTCLGYTSPYVLSKRFDVCIIDEASQASMTTILGPIICANKFILVGDHYQLPPILKYRSDRQSEAPPSLFRVLCESHPHALVTLRTQYRMNSEILKICNSLVYDHKMRPGDLVSSDARLIIPNSELIDGFDEIHKSWLKLVLSSDPSVQFIDIDMAKFIEESRVGSKQNSGEAAIAAGVAISLVLCGVSPDSIGVISPYRSQVMRIKNSIVGLLSSAQVLFPMMLMDLKILSSAIEVHTVDKFQGRDKDCIIFSCVKSNLKRNPGTHVSDWRRLNVAITRAKKKLIFVGSKSTLDNSAFFHDIFALLNEKSFVTLPAGIGDVNVPPFPNLTSVISKSKTDDYGE